MTLDKMVALWSDCPAVAASVRPVGSTMQIIVAWSEDYAAKLLRRGDTITLDGQPLAVVALAFDRETSDGPLFWVITCTSGNVSP